MRNSDDGYQVELWVEGTLQQTFDGMKPAPFLKKLARRKGVELIIRRKETADVKMS